jgi:hypothetical protein
MSVDTGVQRLLGWKERTMSFPIQNRYSTQATSVGLDLLERGRRSEKRDRNEQTVRLDGALPRRRLFVSIDTKGTAEGRSKICSQRARKSSRISTDDAFWLKKNAESDILTTRQNILGAKKSHYWLLTLTKQPSFILNGIQN